MKATERRLVAKTRPASHLALLLVIGCGARSVETHPAASPRSPEPLASATGPRYALPSCPLAYEATIVETSAMGDDPPSASGIALHTTMKIVMTAEGTRIKLAPTVVARPVLGKHRPFVFPQEGLAKPLLETDGRRVSEVEGPTQVWGGMGTLGGLVWFFPPLPGSAAPGASTAWDITRPVAADVLATEAHQGTSAQRLDVPSSPSGQDAKPVHADVRFDRWSEARGQRVAHLTMTAHAPLDESLPDAHMNGEDRWRGSYAVLESGRLLSAEIEKDADATLTSTIAGKTSTQKHTGHATMRLHLVDACDGPTAPRLIPEPTTEERAIVAYADTFAAILKGDKDEALARFDPALRQKHGDDAVWAAISGYRSERGDDALAAPVLVRDEDISADTEVVRLKLRGTALDGRAKQKTMTPVTVEVVLRQEGERFVITSLTSVLTLTKARLLEISPTALAVRAQ